ncbi:MAG: hypothetical protein KKD17_01470 [Nanoarchaeota archaeon]|nr:hypothetical protein [Nanoarchaeota archaeon]
MFEKMDDLTSKLENLRQVLGTEITDQIDGIAERYMGAGMAIGTAGAAVGAGIVYIVNALTNDSLETGDNSMYVFGGFIGLCLGVNIGAVLGRIRASQKIKELKKEHHLLAGYIQMYDDTSREFLVEYRSRGMRISSD